MKRVDCEVAHACVGDVLLTCVFCGVNIPFDVPVGCDLSFAEGRVRIGLKSLESLAEELQQGVVKFVDFAELRRVDVAYGSARRGVRVKDRPLRRLLGFDAEPIG